MPSRRIPLTERSWLEHHAGWLPPAEADCLARRLREGCDWQQRCIVLFGREVRQPRLIAWYGELPYRYSGQTLEPTAMPRYLAAIAKQASHASKTEFNHVLINRYRDGNDSMGRHKDDESELGDAPVVATLSLGAARRFAVYRAKRQAWAAELRDGDLLVMLGDCQQELAHELPKQRHVTQERISLTFRKVLRPPRI